MNDPFSAKYITFYLKKYRGVIFHDNEESCKIWRKADLWFGKWHEKLGKFSPEHSKVTKLGFWWDPFIQNRKCISLKFTAELCVMTMKNGAKFEAELTCLFKLTWGIRQILTRALEDLKNLHFNGLLLTRVYNAWAKKVQRSYVWCHQRLMQNLKGNWLALPKMTWRLWQLSPEHSKVSKLRLWWDPFIQRRKCFSLKLTGELCVITMNDEKFEEELTCQFKTDIRN